MSILKSTNTGRKLYWEKQLRDLSSEVLKRIESLHFVSSKLMFYYVVPDEVNLWLGDRIHPNKTETHRIVFYKQSDITLDYVISEIKKEFNKDVRNIGRTVAGFAIEDIVLEKVRIEISDF